MGLFGLGLGSGLVQQPHPLHHSSDPNRVGAAADVSNSGAYVISSLELPKLQAPTWLSGAELSRWLNRADS